MKNQRQVLQVNLIRQRSLVVLPFLTKVSSLYSYSPHLRICSAVCSRELSAAEFLDNSNFERYAFRFRTSRYMTSDTCLHFVVTSSRQTPQAKLTNLLRFLSPVQHPSHKRFYISMQAPILGILQVDAINFTTSLIQKGFNL